jgi:alpha-L-arabinofuranosidase
MLLPLLLASVLTMQSLHATIRVDTTRPGIKISPDLYGIFFEEINCAGDGGLYAELIRNRSFADDLEKPEHWSLRRSGSVDGEMSLNRGALTLSHRGGDGWVEAVNDGYWGIPIKSGDVYRVSVRAKSNGKPLDLIVRLESSAGKPYASETLHVKGADWSDYRMELLPGATDPNTKLAVSLGEPGKVSLAFVSMFPRNTWRERENGLRSDLAQMLEDLKPSFVRFPGGCWVEGDTMATAQRWKRTVGELTERRTQANLWGYTSGNGLGYHEYLQMCEDLGAAPLFVINCGMSHKEVVPMSEMDEFVQDALDAIEYANGPVTSKWGAVRATNGHPKSFHLKYLEIGNENGGKPYAERYPLIAQAVKDKYPDVKLITNVWGGYPTGPLTETIDEHYYSNPQFFIDNADRYDRYDRNGPKIYVGEYACTEGCGQGNLIAAVGEAAFMTGMERNSDIVTMASYAPLFANVNYKKWNPDLINFDNHRSYGTPSYYVQQMFSRNRGDRILPADVMMAGTEKATFPGGGVGLGTWGTHSEFRDLKVSSNGRTLTTDLRNHEGKWSNDGPVLTQAGDQEPALTVGGSPDWRNYTVEVKARKTGGREGFLLTFGRKDDKNWFWWNVGGWGNHQHAIERCLDGGKTILGQPVIGSIETGRWYDLKVEYTPERIRCYLDGRLIHDVPCPQPKPLHVVASRGEKTGEVILKIVNSGDKPIEARLELGEPMLGTITILTSPSPSDENTLAEPRKVAPKMEKFVTAKSNRTLPPYSVSVIRCKPQ